MKKKDLLAAFVAGGFMLVPMMVQADEIAPEQAADVMQGSESTQDSENTPVTTPSDTNPSPAGSENTSEGTEDADDISGEEALAENDETQTEEANAGDDITNDAQEGPDADISVLSSTGPFSTSEAESEKTVQVGSAAISASQDYTSEDGTISWSAKDKTLTLNNAAITSDGELAPGQAVVSFRGFSDTDGVTVNVKGNSSIYYDLNSLISMELIYADSALNFVGEDQAVLNMYSANLDDDCNIFISSGALNISNLEMNLDGIGSAFASGQNNITVNDSIINLNADQYALTIGGSGLYLKNSELNINEASVRSLFTFDLNLITVDYFDAQDSTINAYIGQQILINAWKGVNFENSEVYIEAASRGEVISGNKYIQFIDSDLTMNINPGGEDYYLKDSGGTTGALTSMKKVILSGTRSYIWISSPNCPAIYVFAGGSFAETMEDDYEAPYVLLDAGDVYLNAGFDPDLEADLEADFAAVLVVSDIYHVRSAENDRFFFDDLDEYAPEIRIGSNMSVYNDLTGEVVKSALAKLEKDQREGSDYLPDMEWAIQTATLVSSDVNEPVDLDRDSAKSIIAHRIFADFSAIYYISPYFDYYQNLYTEESVARLQDALEEVDWDARADEQEQVDVVLAKVLEAFDALEFKTANTAVISYYDGTLDALFEEAVKNGADTFVVDRSEDTLDHMAIDIWLIEDAKDNDMNLEIKTKDMIVTFDVKALTAISDAFTEVVKDGWDLGVEAYALLSVNPVDADALNASQKASLKNAGAYKAVEMVLSMNGKEITNLHGGKIVLSMRVSALADEKSTGYKLILVEKDGTLRDLGSADQNGYVTASISTPSVYAIVDDTVIVSNYVPVKASTTTASTATASDVNTAVDFGTGQYLVGLLLGAAGIIEGKKRRK
jgi:hypothetical protein